MKAWWAQARRVFSSFDTTSVPTLERRNSRITGTNFFASSGLSPSLLNPPTTVAINPAHVLKIEERESKDGTPRCIIHFVDQSMLTWDGKLSALLPLLL